MQWFFLFLVATALVWGLIRVLHTRQLRHTREMANQGMPLPPLDESTERFPSVNSDPNIAEDVNITPGGMPWRDEVKALRDSGRFREALALCSRQYPRMLAFRQTMITLRSQLRAGDESPNEALNEIYRTAIMAGISRARGQDMYTADDIIKLLPHINNPRQYWDQLGYRNLELLTKTDCTLLARHWGEPSSHNDIIRVIEDHSA